MGNTASRAAKNASKLSPNNAARKYPLASSEHTNQQPERPHLGATVGPTVHPQTRISETRDKAIDLDASDPDLNLDLNLNARARKLGPVVPNPTLSNSSTFNRAHGRLSQFDTSQSVFPSRSGSLNPAIGLLEARERLADKAEEEFASIGKQDAAARQFLDVLTLRQVLQMRGKGVSNEEIERKLALKRGIVAVLGKKEIIGLTAAP